MKNNQLNDDHYVYFLLDKHSVIRYVGEGRGYRITKRSGRSPEYLSILSEGGTLVKHAVNLTKAEAATLETDLIKIHSSTIINKTPSNIVKDVNYSFVSKYLVLDKESPTNLSWIDSKTSKHGKHAGGVDGRYFRLMLKGVRYLAHRIVWTLHNQKDLEGFLVVNHIDGDCFNNTPSNLEAVSQKENIVKYHRSKVKND